MRYRLATYRVARHTANGHRLPRLRASWQVPDADTQRDWYACIVEMNRTLGTWLHIPAWYYNLMEHPEAIAQGLDLADIICTI